MILSENSRLLFQFMQQAEKLVNYYLSASVTDLEDRICFTLLLDYSKNGAAMWQTFSSMEPRATLVFSTENGVEGTFAGGLVFVSAAPDDNVMNVLRKAADKHQDSIPVVVSPVQGGLYVRLETVLFGNGDEIPVSLTLERQGGVQGAEGYTDDEYDQAYEDRFNEMRYGISD